MTRAARSGICEVLSSGGRAERANQSSPRYDRSMPLAIIVVLVARAGRRSCSCSTAGRSGRRRRCGRQRRPDSRAGRARARAALRSPAAAAPVTPARARREGLESLDQDYPPAQRRADADVLELLGLVPAGTDLREAAASTYGDSVAGYYDPRSGRLRIVNGAQTANRVLYEMTLAHELNHALEDQRFRLDLERLKPGGDQALAYTALVEGTATAIMNRYAERALRAGGAVRRGRRVGVPRRRRPAAVPDRPAGVPVHGRRGFRRPAAGARRRTLAGRRHGAALPPARLDRADPAPGRLRAGRAAAPCPAARAGDRARSGLAAAAARDVRGVADAEAARARRRDRRERRRRRLGRRPLRAARARGRARARDALDVGLARATRTSSSPRSARGARTGCPARRRTVPTCGELRTEPPRWRVATGP